jgi:hypothetical protein
LLLLQQLRMLPGFSSPGWFPSLRELSVLGYVAAADKDLHALVSYVAAADKDLHALVIYVAASDKDLHALVSRLACTVQLHCIM